MELQEHLVAARAAATLFEACAEALLYQPTERVLRDIKAVAEALGDARFDAIEQSDELMQRYYDRFFVPSSACYIPLRENNLVRSYKDGSRIEYGPNEGPLSDHVIRCYNAVGFDYRALRGFAPARDSLRADSLASECAFVAFLKGKEADVRAGVDVSAGASDAAATGIEAEFCINATPMGVKDEPDVDTGAHLADLSEDFLRRHLRPFAHTAAEYAAADGEDFYAILCAFIRDWADIL